MAVQSQPQQVTLQVQPSMSITQYTLVQQPQALQPPQQYSYLATAASTAISVVFTQYHTDHTTAARTSSSSSVASQCRQGESPRPFSGPPYYSKNFFCQLLFKKSEKKSLPLMQ